MQVPTNSILKDVADLNYQFISSVKLGLETDKAATMLAYELDDNMADFFSSISLQEASKLANSGISLLRTRFVKRSVDALRNYISGDDMAITAVVLGAGA